MTLDQVVEEVSARWAGECTELVAIMREQERLCSMLLELSRGERTAVLEGRLDLLEKATLEKSVLIEQMDRLEQRRRALAGEVARQVGLPSDVSLQGLAERLDGEEAKELLEIRHRVAQAVARLKETNESNLQLMRKSLEGVRDSIRQLRHSVGASAVYTRTGQPRIGVSSTMAVDCHA